MRSSAIAAILASTTVLSGCAGTIAGVSLSSISSFAGFASTLFTGADLGEHRFPCIPVDHALIHGGIGVVRGGEHQKLVDGANHRRVLKTGIVEVFGQHYRRLRPFGRAFAP